MGQTAILSPQIIDSTSIGRDLITAADQAAAQAIIGVTGVDTGADYTWTGDHTFDGSVTLANAEWSNSNGVLNQPDINGFHYLAFSGSNVFRASALDFIPMSNGTKALGRSDLRFSNVYSVDGDFSGTITCGTGGLDIASGSQLRLYNAGSLRLGIGGAGVFFYANTIPNSSETHGTSAKRWGNVYSVDGSFSGNLISETGGSYKLYNLGTEGDADTEYLETFFDANTATIASKVTGTGAERGITLEAYSNNRLKLTSTGFSFAIGGSTKLSSTATDLTFYTTRVRPNSDNSINLGLDGARWANVASVDGDFSGTVTTDELKATLDTGGSLTLRGSTDTYIDVADGVMNFYCNTGQAFRMTSSNVETYKTLKPISTQDLGSTTSRWPNSYFVDGSFSGNLVSETGGSYKLYQLGAEGDPDTQFFEFNTVGSDFYFRSQSTGAGVDRAIYLAAGDSPNIYLSSSDIRFFKAVRPQVTGTTSLGRDSYRWSNVASVDGSFSGNLINEAGGSYKLYNLGTDGDADTEYLETSWDTNVATIGTVATGSGSVRDLHIMRGSNIRLDIGLSNIETYADFRPAVNNNVSCGAASKRWFSVYSVNGDFSGNMTLSNLPTSDPAVAGQLWNSSGTVKISAG